MSSNVSYPRHALRPYCIRLFQMAGCALLGGAAAIHAQNSTPVQSGQQAQGAAGGALPPARVFDIVGFDLDDQAALEPGLLQQVQAVFDAVRGRARTVAQLTAARLSAQALLDKTSARALAVNVPEQTLADGRVRVVIAELPRARLGQVKAVGADGFGVANVLASVPALRKGAELDAEALDRQLRLGELNPFKRTNVTLGQGADGVPGAVVTATAERSSMLYATTDNYGPAKARARLGLGYLDGNFSGRDDVLTLGFTTASDPRRMKGLSASYALPLYAWGQMLEFSAARSESDSGDTVNLFHINGTGSAASVKWSYLLPREGNDNLRLTAGYLYHRADNQVTFAALPGGGSLVPSSATAPLSAGVEGDVRPPELPLLLKGALNLSHNFAGQLGSSDAGALSLVRQGAGSFTMASGRLQADAEPLQGWQLHLTAQGQYTDEVLTSADQLNIAGPYAVRGMRDAGVLGDKALVLNNELVTPAWSGLDPVALRGWAFADWGSVRRNQALAGELQKAVLSSVGVGLRGQGVWGNVDLYLAHKLAGASYDADKGLNSLWLTALLRY